MKKLFILLPVVFILWACASVAPGNDPVVVRAEQLETDAKATFDLVLNIDNANRGFFATNAAPFHAFCETLRQPVTVDGTNTLPRAAAVLWLLDQDKQSYEQLGGSTNALWSAMSTVSTLISQAGAWSQVVTNH